MSSWLDNGRSVLLEAVKAAYDQIGQEARAGMPHWISYRVSPCLMSRPDIDAHEHEKHEILNELHDRSLEVDRLRQENEELKADISHLREHKSETSAASPKKRVILGALSPNKSICNYNVAEFDFQPGNDSPNLAEKYKKSQAELEKTRTELEQVSKLCRGYKSKLRERTKTISQWAEYADGQDKKLQQLRDRLKARQIHADGSWGKNDASSIQDSSPGLVPPKRPGSASTSGRFSLLSSSLATATSHSAQSISPKRIRSEPPLQNDPSTANDAVIHEPAPLSGASAEDNELPPHPEPHGKNRSVTIKQEPSSDGPVFVSTRAVRKRKHEEAEDEPNRPQKIKSEHSCGSQPGEQHHSSAAESIDYEKEAHVPTPRKRKALPRALREKCHVDEEPTPNNERLDMLRSVVSDLTTPDVIRSLWRSDGHVHSAPHLSGVQRDESELPWPPQSPSFRKSSKCWGHHPPRLNVGVMDLAEDGEDGTEPVSHPAVKGRLDILLNPPSLHGLTPAKQRGQANGATSPFKVTSDYDESFKLAPRRGLPFKQTKKDGVATGTPIARSKSSNLSPQPSVVRQRGPHKPSILRDDMPRGRPASREDTPLRERPADKLRPEDFKPNPRYNDGLTYVFDEVVRGKEARAALSGCIDLNCCGKTFRHFAEAERKTIGSSVTSRAEDIKLLETYLGDEAWRLGTMSPGEKEEAWLLAKTWELANKFGKHRQRYSRMPTPPGFWNVDFPSTQERAEERRQAQDIRAALVLQRYREAMRPNGAWLFRDEEPH